MEVPGYPLTPEGQQKWLTDFLSFCAHNPGIAGVFYWSPEWFGEGMWKAFALFDADGNCQAGLAGISCRTLGLILPPLFDTRPRQHLLPVMNLKVTTFFAAVFLGTCLGARAELAFEKTMVELHPKSTDADAVANFKYENKGKTTVKIKSVKTSCGCTVASLKKDEVAPGEKGEVTATFHVAGRTGTQDKGITVETDDPSQPMINLTLRAVIEQALASSTDVCFLAGRRSAEAENNFRSRPART